MKKRIILSLVIITIVVIGATRAFFSDTKITSDYLAASAFTAGTLRLDGAGFTSFDFGNIVLAPGEKTTERSVIIKNVGTMPLAWFGNLIIDGGPKLKEAIYIDSAKMEFLDTAGNVNPANWNDPTDIFITNGRGSGSYPNEYNVVANMSPFQVITLNNFDGHNFMGSTPYEFAGALKPNYSYKLTLKFGFAEGAGNDYQGDVVGGPINVSFRADATQIIQSAITALGTPFTDIAWLNAQIAKQQ